MSKHIFIVKKKSCAPSSRTFLTGAWGGVLKTADALRLLWPSWTPKFRLLETRTNPSQYRPEPSAARQCGVARYRKAGEDARGAAAARGWLMQRDAGWIGVGGLEQFDGLAAVVAFAR
jgi:hypothetical protein